eukprot:gene5131-6545_t
MAFQYITTVVGNGATSASIAGAGDGGLPTAAFISKPGGFWMDTQGTMYLTEILGNKVRKVDSQTGFISTLVGTGIIATTTDYGDGGAATSAKLSAPAGVLKLRATGVVYFSDTGLNRVRTVSTDGIVATIAGTGTANNAPVAID